MVCCQLFFQIRLLLHKRATSSTLNSNNVTSAYGNHHMLVCTQTAFCLLPVLSQILGSFYRILNVGTFFFFFLSCCFFSSANSSRKKNAMPLEEFNFVPRGQPSYPSLFLCHEYKCQCRKKGRMTTYE